MIGSVSFRSGLQANTPAKDLYSAPQKFQRTAPYAEGDVAPKKSGKGKKVAIGAVTVAALATLLALGAKKGKFDPKVLGDDAGILKKGVEGAKKYMKVAGEWIAEKAGSVWAWGKNLIAKKSAAPTA